MTDLVTIHLGSRAPKAYAKDSAPDAPVLLDEQPEGIKCRVKIRLSKHSSLAQSLDEIKRCWVYLDHADAPVWVSGTNAFSVQMVAELFGGIEVRPWEPSEGDE